MRGQIKTTTVETILVVAVIIVLALWFVGCASPWSYDEEKTREEQAIKSFETLSANIFVLLETIPSEKTFAYTRELLTLPEDYYIYAFNTGGQNTFEDYDPYIPDICQQKTCICLFKKEYKQDKTENNKNKKKCQIMEYKDKKIVFAPDLKTSPPNSYEARIDSSKRILLADSKEFSQQFILALYKSPHPPERITFGGYRTIDFDVAIGTYYGNPKPNTETFPDSACQPDNNPQCGSKGFMFEFKDPFFIVTECTGTRCPTNMNCQKTQSEAGNEVIKCV